MQKKALRITTFSEFDEHSCSLFKELQILKFSDIVKSFVAIFMYKFYNHQLPSVFNELFILVDQIHSHNTRLACRQTYDLPIPHTNYGIFNVRFQGPKIWNSVEENVKALSLLSSERF